MKISFHLDLRSILRWFVAVVLLWAALGKLANLQEFFVLLLAYRLPLPTSLLKVVAVVLPWLELLSGLLLFGNFKAGTALAWSLTLFLVFMVCTGQAWLRGLPIACGCLDLRVIGLQEGSAIAKFFESAGFAFFRAAVLASVTWMLLKSKVVAPRENHMALVAATATGRTAS